MLRKILPGLYLFFVIFFPIQATRAGVQESPDPIAFQRGELSIQSQGRSHKFSVEIARTFEQRARGLMFRKNMIQSHGMLFLFEQNQMVSMWMKNTFIPLDIIFIDRRGIIVNIVRAAKPHALDHIKSVKPVISVLELNAHMTRQLNIQAGDVIIHPFFTP